jgi:imidazole glycerol phosphate synthase subunit HisF
MDLEAPARSIQRQHLLAKSLLALFSRNIALLDIANSRRGRAFVQVLHKLAQRVLVALCFAGDLEIMSMDCDCSTV